MKGKLLAAGFAHTIGQSDGNGVNFFHIVSVVRNAVHDFPAQRFISCEILFYCIAVFLQRNGFLFKYELTNCGQRIDRICKTKRVWHGRVVDCTAVSNGFSAFDAIIDQAGVAHCF